jgi:hypothetical protein
MVVVVVVMMIMMIMMWSQKHDSLLPLQRNIAYFFTRMAK